MSGEKEEEKKEGEENKEEIFVVNGELVEEIFVEELKE